jgi:hypothetical protein
MQHRVASLWFERAGRVTLRGAPLAGAVVTANLIGEGGPASVTVARRLILRRKCS